MKIFKSNFVGYSIELTIVIFLCFSFVYSFVFDLNLTYGVKDVFILVSLLSTICSIVFLNKQSVKMVSLASIVAMIGGYIYYRKNSLWFQEAFSKLEAAFFWFIDYINHDAPLSIEYQEYVFWALSMIISLLVYVFFVKRFSFYILLVGGAGLFATQWILYSYVSYLSFYIFVFFILLCYFKHIYIRNTDDGQRDSYRESIVFLLSSIPICVIVFAFAYFMPSREQPIEWAWMDSKIHAVQNYITGKFNSGYSNPITGFDEESTLLKGDITLNNNLVMKVDSPEGGLYLKGAVREFYTGKSWKSLETNQIYIGQKDQLNNFNNDLFELLNGSKVIEDRINILGEFNRTFITITYENLITKSLLKPINTYGIKFESKPVEVLVDSYGMLSSDHVLEKFEYTVDFFHVDNNNEILARLLRSSTRGLYNNYLLETRRTLRNLEFRSDISILEQVSNEVYMRYLQLPVELPERVRELAIEITSEAENNYDRVKAIESYLSNNYRYTLKPGKLPDNQDFVDYFLFDSKQGYCTYYASAMAVLVRSIGIPARYVEGFVLPSQPVQGTLYEVTNKQAHAWVEVYFEGVGWIPFEPTSAYSQDFYDTFIETFNEEEGMPDQIDSEEAFEADVDSIENLEVPEETENTPIQTNTETELESTSVTYLRYWIILMTLFVFLLWIVAFPILKRRILINRIQRLNPQEAVVEMYRFFLKVLSLQGYEMVKGETPLQFANRIDENLAFAMSDFKTITTIFVKARYSNSVIHQKEVQLIKEFYSTFTSYCKGEIGPLKFFVYNNILGRI